MEELDSRMKKAREGGGDEADATADPAKDKPEKGGHRKGAGRGGEKQ